MKPDSFYKCKKNRYETRRSIKNRIKNLILKSQNWLREPNSGHTGTSGEVQVLSKMRLKIFVKKQKQKKNGKRTVADSFAFTI